MDLLCFPDTRPARSSSSCQAELAGPPRYWCWSAQVTQSCPGGVPVGFGRRCQSGTSHSCLVSYRKHTTINKIHPLFYLLGHLSFIDNTMNTVIGISLNLFYVLREAPTLPFILSDLFTYSDDILWTCTFQKLWFLTLFLKLEIHLEFTIVITSPSVPNNWTSVLQFISQLKFLVA